MKVHLVDGTFTAADIMMGYSLLLARRFNVLAATAHPNVNAYMARLENASFVVLDEVRSGPFRSLDRQSHPRSSLAPIRGDTPTSAYSRSADRR
jgi:hypothetical protein